MVVHPAFWRVVSRAALELVQALVYGPYLVGQINALGKRQILGKADRWSSRE